MIATLRDLVYPPTCAGCGRSHGGEDPYFCLRCAVLLAWREPIRCPLCEQPTTHRGLACEACQQRWPAVVRLITLGYYAGSLQRAVKLFKYGGCRPLGEYLGDRLGQRVVSELGGIDRVVPVPGGKVRARSRGFDPPAVVAAAVARWLGVPMDPTVLLRGTDGVSMTSRSRLDRELQVEGRFECRRPRALRGQRILLVDDVYTTGVSMEQGCQLLLEVAGARSVFGAVLARTVVDLRLV
jgi:competence protein ComFC